MKYKVEKGHALYDQLLALHAKKEECREQAKALCAELGGEEHATSNNHAAGGIDAIRFKEKPEGWKTVGNSWQNLFQPLAKNRAAWDKIQALPRVSHDEQNDIIGFKHGAFANSSGFSWVNTYGVGKAGDVFIISTPDNPEFKYKPVDGMVEITVSEFNKLSESIS